jgi:hypothetical protein
MLASEYLALQADGRKTRNDIAIERLGQDYSRSR